MPSTFIGGFADPTSTRRPRDRPLWAAHRESGSVFRTTADKVGVDGGDPRIYATPSDPAGTGLESLWAHAENSNKSFHDAVDGAALHGGMHARDFVSVVAPFVATLLARHPRLVLEAGLSRLDSTAAGQDDEVRLRRTAFQRYCDVLVYKRRWSAIRSAQPIFVTSDLGWQWLPGLHPGQIILPTSPDTALLIDGGIPSYNPTSDSVHFFNPPWPVWLLELYRDAMILGTPGEIYTHDRALAEHAATLWTTPAPVVAFDKPDVTAHLLGHWPSYVSAGLLQDGAGQDSGAAWLRFLVAQHRFACNCEQGMIDGGLNREDRRKATRHMHRQTNLAEAAIMSERGRLIPHRTIGVAVAIRLFDDGLHTMVFDPAAPPPYAPFHDDHIPERAGDATFTIDWANMGVSPNDTTTTRASPGSSPAYS